jgi:hypothetical protein
MAGRVAVVITPRPGAALVDKDVVKAFMESSFRDCDIETADVPESDAPATNITVWNGPKVGRALRDMKGQILPGG